VGRVRWLANLAHFLEPAHIRCVGSIGAEIDAARLPHSPALLQPHDDATARHFALSAEQRRSLLSIQTGRSACGFGSSLVWVMLTPLFVLLATAWSPASSPRPRWALATSLTRP